MSDIENEEIVDGLELEEETPEVSYNISSYGADYDTEGLVKRLKREDIVIPPFQREYVWRINEASRFIESLLLGLPVPGIFLAKEQETNKLLVIDGQQRLKTIQFFYDGYFNPKDDDKKRTVFSLKHVQKRYEGSTYNDLSEEDRRKINDYLIHATIIKQESPKDNDTSIYHIFERLNSEGRKLTEQEIRTAIYHGKLIDLIRDLNEYSTWRNLYGKKSVRMRDQELIMRFFAFSDDNLKYRKPLTEFLNIFSITNQNPTQIELDNMKTKFISTIDYIMEELGQSAFRFGANLNAAIFDSVSVTISNYIKQNGSNKTNGLLKSKYETLLKDADFIKSVTEATSDDKSVETRFKRAKEILL